jgi:rhodanese-related sulfurtransferase
MLALEDGMSRKHPKSISGSSKSIPHQSQKRQKSKLTWLWISLVVLLVAIAGILLLRPKAEISVEITPAQAFVKFQQGAFFLDVRNKDEWNQMHIAGSTLIPLDELPTRLSELPKDQEIVVVCLSGHRSQSGTVILQKAGFKRVFCLGGGLTAWKAAGYALEGTNP